MFTLVLVGISLAVAAFVAAYVVRYINKTEKDLRLEKENAVITLQSIEDGVIRTDDSSRIIYMNPSAESILGKSTACCAGMPVCDVVTVYDGTSGAAINRPLQNNGCMSGNDDQGRDMYLLHSSGEKIWVENSVTPILTEGGAVAGNVLVIHDISENHNFKQQLLSVNRDLAELNTTLETRVGLRTRELEQTNLELQQTIRTLSETQDQLIHSEKMASLGGLVAGISHEINTPLGIAVTSASSLQEETENIIRKFADSTLKRSEMDKFLQHAGQASDILLQNLSRASNMIRSFKQVAVDQSSEDWRTIDLKSYVDEILMSLRPRLKNRRITIHNLCQPNLVLYVNPGAIYQIISNFIMNSLIHAYDSTVDEGVITISARQEKGMVVMQYSDDGSGISDEIRKKIFEPFFTTRRGRGGSGLGLNIVYNLINTTLNGSVEVSSEPGKGTRFTAEFPALYERDAS